MKKTPIGLLVAAIAISSLTVIGSCVKTDNATCTTTSESPVVKVEGKDTVGVNVADTLLVGFLVRNNCGKSAVINPSVATTGTNVHIITTYEGCVCTSGIFQVNKQYIFKSPNPGNYTLSFWGGDNTTIIEKTIVVK